MAKSNSHFSLVSVSTWIWLGVLRLVAFLPHPWMLALGRGVGRLAERLAARRRAIVDRNFELCFPHMSLEERRQLRRRHFESYGMGLMDVAIAWWWSTDRVMALSEVEGEAHLRKAMSLGRGIILLTAHTSSLEISGRILQTLLPIHAMYRPNENLVLERFISSNRPKHIEGIIQRDNPRLMIKTLKQGGAVWYAPDQSYKGKGFVYADFFGNPAATNAATSRFAERTNSVVVPVVALRTSQGRYRLIIEPMFDDYPSSSPTEDARRMNRVIEQWALRAPEQYNWLHRRFKHQPEGAESVY